MEAEKDSIRDDLKKEGYSKEEEYFYRENREHIERRRKELEEKRAEREAENQKLLRLMRCPKCGQTMEEVNHLGIRMSRCVGCQGLFLDRDEMETLVKSRGHQVFLHSLWKRIQNRIFKVDTSWQP
jgi:Zn-finger nucleic acid-binding protein